MIEISPKALRFARLAAEEQPSFSSNAQLSMIAAKERGFRSESSKYVEISDETATFCLRAITAFLESQTFESDEWDGNDFLFLKDVAQSLSEKLHVGLGAR